MDAEVKKCPHCDSTLHSWMPPEDSSWVLFPQKVCFNDECGYYVNGWKHMEENFGRPASYRHRQNPNSNELSGQRRVTSSRSSGA